MFISVPKEVLSTSRYFTLIIRNYQSNIARNLGGGEWGREGRILWIHVVMFSKGGITRPEERHHIFADAVSQRNLDSSVIASHAWQ